MLLAKSLISNLQNEYLLVRSRVGCYYGSSCVFSFLTQSISNLCRRKSLKFSEQLLLAFLAKVFDLV